MTLVEDSSLMQEVERIAEDKTFVTIRQVKRELGITGQKASRILKAMGFKRWSCANSAYPVWYKPEEGD